MPDIAETARAKINLALHVTGQRDDGYHEIETIVVFADHGDRLSFTLSDHDRLTLSGRFASDLSGGADNLVIKARNALRGWAEQRGIAAAPVAIDLEKNLPVASGIGGGSADAAACLRGLQRFWNINPPRDELDALALELGADVPMCLTSTPLLARGIGEDITPLEQMPDFFLVLVNPGAGVATPEVFTNLARKDNSPIGAFRSDALDLISRLSELRNDLEPVAIGLEPVIGEVIAALQRSGTDLARMSGSGATCFGLYPDLARATEAAQQIRNENPAWYVQACRSGSK